MLITIHTEQRKHASSLFSINSGATAPAELIEKSEVFPLYL